MSDRLYDVAVVGGGIVGLSTAMALAARSRASLILVEAERSLASHQTGHNSGVIHSGLYYKPGSLRARNCVEGREALYRFCREQAVPHERCGKVVVATRELELPALEALEARGKENGLAGLRRLTAEELREHEPHAAGIAGLLVPETGIVDFVAVAHAYARIAREAGATIRTEARVRAVHRGSDEWVLLTGPGEVHARHLINCAGLESDRVARMCGLNPDVRILPFRGEYYALVPGRTHLVKNLIYPVPDPRLPFLGVHLTRMVRGGVEAGPNAVLAASRYGYRRLSFSARDFLEIARFSGFWRLSLRFWRSGLAEIYRSFSKRAFVRDLKRLVPELEMDDVRPAGSGVRAMAVEPSGRMVDDFRIVRGGRGIHLLAAPSPAATASLSIGATIAELALGDFSLAGRNP